MINTKILTQKQEYGGAGVSPGLNILCCMAAMQFGNFGLKCRNFWQNEKFLRFFSKVLAIFADHACLDQL